MYEKRTPRGTLLVLSMAKVAKCLHYFGLFFDRFLSTSWFCFCFGRSKLCHKGNILKQNDFILPEIGNLETQAT